MSPFCRVEPNALEVFSTWYVRGEDRYRQGTCGTDDHLSLVMPHLAALDIPQCQAIYLRRFIPLGSFERGGEQYVRTDAVFIC